MLLAIGNVYCIYEMQSLNQSSSSGCVSIGDISINLPENFSSNNNLEISNGADTIIISEISNSSLDSAVDEYVDKFSGNYSISVNDFDSKFSSKKTVAVNVDNSSITKYWFEIDNNVYQLQVSSKNDVDFDEIAKNMINSISK